MLTAGVAGKQCVGLVEGLEATFALFDQLNRYLLADRALKRFEGSRLRLDDERSHFSDQLLDLGNIDAVALALDLLVLGLLH